MARSAAGVSDAARCTVAERPRFARGGPRTSDRARGAGCRRSHPGGKRQTTASTMVRSPIDGVVTELGAREGAAFAVGASLFRINGLTSVWVNAQIPEARVSMVP